MEGSAAVRFWKSKERPQCTVLCPVAQGRQEFGARQTPEAGSVSCKSLSLSLSEMGQEMATAFSSALRAHSPSLQSRPPPGAKLSAAHSPLKGCPIDFTPPVIAAEYSSSLPGSQLQEALL